MQKKKEQSSFAALLSVQPLLWATSGGEAWECGRSAGGGWEECGRSVGRVADSHLLVNLLRMSRFLLIIAPPSNHTLPRRTYKSKVLAEAE